MVGLKYRLLPPFPVLLAALFMSAPAAGHHGWGWAETELTELTGRVTDVRLGNPHGEVDLKVDGEIWTVQVGQPWRNDRAGLTAKRLERGVELTVMGNVSNREDARVVKAVRVTIDGRHHDLYPGRLPEPD